jgi:aminodeoxyfutalosine synthase
VVMGNVMLKTRSLTPAASNGTSITDGDLEGIAQAIESGRRLTIEEGMSLYRTPDLWRVLELADQVRRRMHSDAVYYNINRHINYSQNEHDSAQTFE